MAAVAHDDAYLRQRACCHLHCHAIFYICSHCDRGHRYCSPECRHQARLDQRRSANRRHQQSEAGRLDHCDRQRDYRQRCRSAAAKSVTDQGSISIASPASLPRGQSAVIAVQAPARYGIPRCRICGCALRFINPYPRIPPRK
jgi:hypothetical protein